MHSDLPLLIANWKMNLNLDSAKILADQIKKINYENLIICPSHILLSLVSSELQGSSVSLGAQDISHLCETSGAFTGDVSAMMIKEMGCKYTILGHSERRIQHMETSLEVKRKVEHAHSQSIIGILCIGENLKERKNNKTLSVLAQQISESIPDSANAENLIIAYEPVWAIGGKEPATIQEISEIANFITEYTRKKFEKSFKIMYGGSVNSTNIESIISIKNIKGVLIGASSLKINELNDIIGIAKKS